ncbi:MAG TPA: HAD hydrolase-like protein [Deltaproteobacteria bacterium]|nr:HAD hydrolase-like protein [Deltaproteobacteria bacterium]
MGRGLSVSFDLDGTLTDLAFVDGVWNEGLPELVAEELGVGVDEAARLCMEAYLSEGDASIKWYRLAFWLERFGLGHVDEDALISAFTGRIRAFEDGLRALRALRERGYPLVLFSNAPRAFLDREVEQCGLEPFFDTIVSLPDDWDTVKSQEAAFVRLQGLVGTDVVHVGDHILFDYEVPRRAGLEAYHLWRGKGPRLEHSLASLDCFVDRIIRGQAQP